MEPSQSPTSLWASREFVCGLIGSAVITLAGDDGAIRALSGLPILSAPLVWVLLATPIGIIAGSVSHAVVRGAAGLVLGGFIGTLLGFQAVAAFSSSCVGPTTICGYAVFGFFIRLIEWVVVPLLPLPGYLVTRLVRRSLQ
jgi:hypothetical protein